MKKNPVLSFNFCLNRPWACTRSTIIFGLFVLVTLLQAVKVQAAPLAIYTGTGGVSISVSGSPNTTTSLLTAIGFGAANLCGSGGISGLTVPVTITTFNENNPYVGYKIYPTPGHTLNMFRIHARARVSGNGPTKARIAYRFWSNGLPSGWISEAADVDLVASSCGSCGTSTDSWDFYTGIPANPNPTVNGITDSIEVAVFPFAPGLATGAFQLNELEVYGIATTDADCNGGTIGTTADAVVPATVNICGSSSSTLTYNVGSGGIAGVNILYQWQISFDGYNWNDIANANGVVFQTPVLQAGIDPPTIYYRMEVICDATGDVDFSDASTVTVNPIPSNAGIITGYIAASSQLPYGHMLIGTNYTLFSSIPGGTWSSDDVSVISVDPATGVATPHIPGDAVITYSISVNGCVGTSTETLVSYYPGTKALYVGRGGNSVNVYASNGATANNLNIANFTTTSTACNNGGISGRTNITTAQDVTTNGRITTVVTSTGAPFLVNMIRATVRETSFDVYQAYLGYRPVGSSFWIFDPAPVTVETNDCGYSQYEIILPLSPSVMVTPIGVEFGVFAYNGASYLGFQVNSISVIGTGTQLMNGSIVATTTNSDIILSPNPATNMLDITADQKVNVIVFSIEGKKLIEQKDAKRIDISSLVSGMYLIRVYSENNALLKTEKIIKN